MRKISKAVYQTLAEVEERIRKLEADTMRIRADAAKHRKAVQEISRLRILCRCQALDRAVRRRRGSAGSAGVQWRLSVRRQGRSFLVRARSKPHLHALSELAKARVFMHPKRELILEQATACRQRALISEGEGAERLRKLAEEHESVALLGPSIVGPAIAETQRKIPEER